MTKDEICEALRQAHNALSMPSEPTKRPLAGLSDAERSEVRDCVPFTRYITLSEYAYRVQIETEKKIMEKNK